MAAFSKQPPPKSLLRPFIFLSSALHALILVFVFVFSPIFAPKPRVHVITLNLNAGALAPSPLPAPEPAVASPQPVPAAPKAPRIQETPVRAKTETPVQRTVRPVPKPLAAAAPVAPPTPALTPAPAAPLQPAPAIQTPAVSTPVAQPERNLAQEDNDALASQVDSLLRRASASPAAASDYLAGGMWTGSPRKTVAFPNIKARIAELQNRGGFGYSVTARITFTPQGWVSMVELTQASGDPRIDNIFRNELRKIRIEESPGGNTDTVLKSFVISVQ